MELVTEGKTSVTLSPRSPIKSLSSDSPMVNKKRKQVSSPDCRNAKQAKIHTKENEDEIQIIEENIKDEDKNHNNESSKVDSDSKNKKSTPSNKGKNKKSDNKIQSNLLTKFLKKIDDKGVKDSESQSTTVFNKKQEDYEEENSEIKSVKKDYTVHQVKVVLEKIDPKKINCNIQEKCDNSEKEQNGAISENNDQDLDSSKEKMELDETIKSQDETIKSQDETIKSQDDNSDQSKSCLDVESDESSSLSDDDSSKQSIDNKRTDHEDTDSKDSKDSSIKKPKISLTPKVKLDAASKKLTPKQIEKKLESQKKREAREKQRMEREKKLQEERENRKKEKEDKKRERDEKKKEKEEKEKVLKEQKRIEREQKEAEKQAEIERKQKEKEAKEESRRKREEAKEEERKRKEEEKVEAERKKQKAASNFVSFFVAKKPTETKSAEEEKKVEKTNFMPFEVKADMRVAPNVRRILSDNEKSKLDEIVSSPVNKLNSLDKLYIKELKKKNYKSRKSGKTWPYEANDDVVVLDDDEEGSNIVQASNSIIEKHRPKLLMFADNRRPPYWGTWRKTSKSVNPRRPFAKDTECFDYEIDSDDEWEEEEPGESLRGSDDEKDKDEDNADENEYDVDNDFMVPHGYLSEEEIVAEDEDEEDDDLNPEKQKTKLEILGKQFEAEMKAKTQKLKPKVIGCVWLNEKNDYSENTPAKAVQFLTSIQAWVRDTPVKLTPPPEGDCVIDEHGTPSTSKANVASSVKKARALEDAMPDLIRLLHGNIQNKNFLMKEFVAFWDKKTEGKNPIPKSKLNEKIKETSAWISCPEAGPMQDKYCWFVQEEFRKKYLPDEKLPLPNTWNYILTPKRKNGLSDVSEKIEEKNKEKKMGSLITQFTKAQEKGDKTVSPPSSGVQGSQKVTPQPSKPPKRASLITLPSSTTPSPAPSGPKSTPLSNKQPKRATLITISSPGKTPSLLKATPPSGKQPKRASLISLSRGESKSPRMSLMDKFVKKENGKTNDTQKKTDSDDDDDDCKMIDNDEKNTESSAENEKKEINELAKKIDQKDEPVQKLDSSSDAKTVDA